MVEALGTDWLAPVGKGLPYYDIQTNGLYFIWNDSWQCLHCAPPACKPLRNTSFWGAGGYRKWESIKHCLLHLCGKEKKPFLPQFNTHPPLDFLSALFAMKDFTSMSSLLLISELLILRFLCSCFCLRLGVHSEAGGSRAGFVSHLPDAEDPHSPQTVPCLHAPGRPPPTTLIPPKCYWRWIFTLQWSTRYQEKKKKHFFSWASYALVWSLAGEHLNQQTVL